MQLSGRRIRNTCIIVFDAAVVAAFSCHGIRASWFWSGLGVLLVLCILIIFAVEFVRLVAPDHANGWWDPD